MPIKIGEHSLFANLIEIEMYDFDVILSMDWLTTHYTVIGCQKKRARFSPPNANSFEFEETLRGRLIPTISTLQSKKLIDSRCRGYMVNIVDTTKERESVPSDVSKVREYLTVFPEDLPGLPLDREIEFCIELIPRTAPI